LAFWSRTAVRAAADFAEEAASGPRIAAPERAVPAQVASPITDRAAGVVDASRARSQVSIEQMAQAAEASKVLMTALGQITSLLMRSAQHRQLPIADLEWLALPPVMSGQFLLAEAQMKGNGMMAPVGLVLWAAVSPEVDKRLDENLSDLPRLKPEEWKSGNLLWVIEAIGEGSVVQAMLKRKMDAEWQGRPVKMRVRDKAGVMRVGTLAAEKSPAPVA
jgi:cytolysin-activating lysine-acyltransferase